MTAQHTPGPWSLGEGEYEDHVFGSDGYEVMGAPTWASLHRDFFARRMGDGHWATTPGAFINRREEESMANARLTVAAPDMLEALKSAERTFATQEEVLGASIGSRAALAKIRAAIAKAEGR